MAGIALRNRNKPRLLAVRTRIAPVRRSRAETTGRTVPTISRNRTIPTITVPPTTIPTISRNRTGPTITMPPTTIPRILRSRTSRMAPMTIDVAIIAMNRSVPCRHGGMHPLKELPMSLRTCVISLLASTMLLACGGNQPQDADSTTGPAVVEADAGPATAPEQPGNAAAGGVDACEGVDAQLTDARKHAYALLVAALDAKVKPEEVDVSAFLEDGAWSMVLASTPVTDPGYF